MAFSASTEDSARSVLGRRMSDTAVWLTEHVIPRVQIRRRGRDGSNSTFTSAKPSNRRCPYSSFVSAYAMGRWRHDEGSRRCGSFRRCASYGEEGPWRLRMRASTAAALPFLRTSVARSAQASSCLRLVSGKALSPRPLQGVWNRSLALKVCLVGAWFITPKETLSKSAMNRAPAAPRDGRLHVADRSVRAS